MSDAPGSSRLWPRICIAVWSLVFLGVCARTLVMKNDAHSVYPVFTNAAENWLNGQTLYQRGGTEEFRYSPLIAAFFVPFELLPYRLGHFIWRSLNFAVFVAGLGVFCAAGLPRRMSRNQIASVFLLVIPLAIGSLNNAQSNPLVIGLLLAATAGAMRRHWTAAAIAITVATLFKVYPLSLGLLLAMLYPARFAWRLAVTLAAGLVLPFLLQRAGYVLEQYRIWLNYLSSEDRQRGPIADWYKDLRAVWKLYVGSMTARQYLFVELGIAVGIGISCLLARVRRWPAHRLLMLTFCLACCWMTATGPATESATYILLAPVVACMLVDADAYPPARLRRIGYAIAFGLFAVAQMALWIGPTGKWFRDRLQPLPIAGLILLVVVLLDAIARLWRPDTSQNV